MDYLRQSYVYFQYRGSSKSRLQSIVKDETRPRPRWRKTAWDVPDSPPASPVKQAAILKTMEIEEITDDGLMIEASETPVPEQYPQPEENTVTVNGRDVIECHDVSENVESMDGNEMGQFVLPVGLLKEAGSSISSLEQQDKDASPIDPLPSTFSQEDTIIVNTSFLSDGRKSSDLEDEADVAVSEPDSDTIVLQRTYTLPEADSTASTIDVDSDTIVFKRTTPLPRKKVIREAKKSGRRKKTSMSVIRKKSRSITPRRARKIP